MENSKFTEYEMDYMDSFSVITTGIKDVILWLGETDVYTQPIIKVSNYPNEIKNRDCFTIILPEKNIIGFINTGFITDDIMKQIFYFIDKNYKYIELYSKGEITTDKMCDFLKNNL